MKTLADYYTERDISFLADGLKEMALAEPGTKKRHVFLNDVRVSVEFDSERKEFRAYMGCAGQLNKQDREIWKAALGASESENLTPREYMHTGKIYYAPGFRWSAKTHSGG